MDDTEHSPSPQSDNLKVTRGEEMTQLMPRPTSRRTSTVQKNELPPLRIDGKLQSEQEIALIAEAWSSVQNNLKSLVPKLRTPKLVAIIVGNDPASQTYVSHKVAACKRCGFDSEVINLPATLSDVQLQMHLKTLALDSSVHAMLLQLPLPKQLDISQALDIIPPEKDADGITLASIGNLAADRLCRVLPCTPLGIWRLLQSSHIITSGKRVAIIGRSQIVGRPLELLLSRKDYGNATVTLLHSESKECSLITRECDIVISATGVPQSIDATWLKDGAIAIDVGIHRDGKRLIGDMLCDDSPRSILTKVSAYTPVPGGVGPMTVAMLMRNTWNLYLSSEGIDSSTLRLTEPRPL